MHGGGVCEVVWSGVHGVLSLIRRGMKLGGARGRGRGEEREIKWIRVRGKHRLAGITDGIVRLGVIQYPERKTENRNLMGGGFLNNFRIING